MVALLSAFCLSRGTSSKLSLVGWLLLFGLVLWTIWVALIPRDGVAARIFPGAPVDVPALSEKRLDEARSVCQGQHLKILVVEERICTPAGFVREQWPAHGRLYEWATVRVAVCRGVPGGDEMYGWPTKRPGEGQHHE
jgi:hypothetical protein